MFHYATERKNRYRHLLKWQADLIPRFLKFRIPNNGCFDEKTVHNFQKQLLKKELCRAKQDLEKTQGHLEEKRDALRNTAPDKCIPSIILHTRSIRRKAGQEQSRTHAKKLLNLSEEQERPLFNVKNTVVIRDLDKTPPTYVLETLSLGPKNAVLD